ncbi:hypothetical protein VTL71DRAFT_5027 [Oculimacula yallundae]|uniref:Uncharacterized protein n=1 Tax=Oculimacula yallundae TaxID=86028 RepID=A0ABR4BZZ9_9HELO
MFYRRINNKYVDANNRHEVVKATYCDSDKDSDTDSNGETEYADNSRAKGGAGSDDNMIFDFKDDGNDNGTANEDINEYSGLDSGYNSDRTDITITKDTDKCYTTETNNTTFLFKENPFAILCLIFYILTRTIRDDAVLVDGYTSAKPFFATDLKS